MKRPSKAQISIFVIISLILVIGSIVFFSLTNNSITIFQDEKSSYKVKTFVESCLDLETKAAIEKIGLHGGWLYHDEMVTTNRKMPAQYNKVAKGLNLFEKQEIPYWYYYDDADEVFRFNIPDYDSEYQYSIKNQVKKYVEDNLERDCIQSFRSFEDIYEIKYEPREIKGKITVEFDEDKIVTSLEMPLEIHEITTQNVELVDYFSVNNDNKLWIPYHLARDITLAQANSSFIEYRILNFINAYQTANNREGLPPFYEFSMKYDFVPWDVRKVENLTKQVIGSNIGLVQFLNTDYNEVKLSPQLKNSPFAQGFVNIYQKDYLSQTSMTKEDVPKIFNNYQNYKVKPIYEGAFFPSSFKLSPSMGNVILLPRPEAVINLIPFFFTEYIAVYEMTMPILFEIKSNEANDKFVFNLAIEANIDHNTPLSQNRNIEFKLDDLGDMNSAKSLICDPVQFTSDYIYLNISDPINHGLRKKYDDPKIGVEDAIVTFNCKGLASCFIAQTEINGKYVQNNITELKFRVPTNCDPGRLEIYKYGYTKLIFDNLDPKINEPINLGEVEMASQKTLDLKVRLVTQGTNFNTGRTLDDSETAFLIFQNLEDDSLVQVAQITPENQYNLTINLTVGNYSIEGFVIHNESFTIPSQQFCYKKGLFSGSDCQNVPAIDFDSWVRGGIELETFEVTKYNLLNFDIIKVNFVDYGIPRSYDDLAASSNAMADLKNVSIKPDFD